ncbi:MAG TPA: uroporphyrinogen-III synthase [Candidatus Acidoferrum sp.]|jgi:uroporphyrinogen-III synthase|nr:uroporphyrinogen-III synthase [Candidatus Acidoferrum sp.]
MPDSRFAGLRVLSFESRRAVELARLIASYGGKPVSAPALREVPLAPDSLALDFAAGLMAGRFQMVIFLTGVGVQALVSACAKVYGAEPFLDALRRAQIVVRGPKPAAALRELQIPVAAMAREPNTWREVLQAIDSAKLPLAGTNVAVQEYGVSNGELLAALRERGAQITQVPVYQWALPEDTGPLREGIALLVRGEIDVVLFTTGVQVMHLFKFAAQHPGQPNSAYSADMLRHALRSVVVASIGPSTTEALEQYGLRADLQASRPKMGFLVKEAAELSPGILERKRSS